AAADYGVSIVEDFTPPEDWLPGQEINKDVSIVNTGNIDAYVRVAILNDLQLNSKGAGAAIESEAIVLPDAGTNQKLVELSNKASDTNANEVSTLQAGGTLVWTPDGAVAAGEQQYIRSGDDSDDNSAYDGDAQFKPEKTGLYLFRRTGYEGGKIEGIKYSGYFFVKGSAGDPETSKPETPDKYYALETEEKTIYALGTITEAGGVVTSVSGIKLATTKDTTIENAGTANVFAIKWYKGTVGATEENEVDAGANTATWIQLSYAAVSDKPVLLNIKLADDWATNWTYIQTNVDPKTDDKNDFGYFYYNKILKAGYTSEKLIDSVTLDSKVDQDAYNEFIYDLTAVLDSVQIIKDDAGTYKADTVKTWISGATVDTNGKPTWTTGD
ncbi:MAG: hypothetical protein IJ561_03315, partial [Ruminococcus sp.]|nr:hypothetical protein [Ruminococcus sp.]